MSCVFVEKLENKRREKKRKEEEKKRKEEKKIREKKKERKEEGSWQEVEKMVSKLGLKNQKNFLYAIYKQQYLEFIESGEPQKVFSISFLFFFFFYICNILHCVNDCSMISLI